MTETFHLLFNQLKRDVVKSVKLKTQCFTQYIFYQAVRQEVEFTSSIFHFAELLEKTHRREEEMGALQVYFLLN